MSLRVSNRYAAYVRKEQMPIPRRTKCVLLGSRVQRALLSSRPDRSGVFVISTGAQRSGEIWPTIGRTFPFETRFLRYVMLRLTPVGMTKCAFAFSGE